MFHNDLTDTLSISESTKLDHAIKLWLPFFLSSDRWFWASESGQLKHSLMNYSILKANVIQVGKKIATLFILPQYSLYSSYFLDSHSCNVEQIFYDLLGVNHCACLWLNHFLPVDT